MILAALGGRLEVVVDALGPDFFGHVGGGPPGTLLHHASWVGNPAIVERLLARGADPVAPSGAEFDTPVAWAVLGSQYHASPGRDYVAVVQRLLAAGAQLEPRFAEVAEGPLAGLAGRARASVVGACCGGGPGCGSLRPAYGRNAPDPRQRARAGTARRRAAVVPA